MLGGCSRDGSSTAGETIRALFKGVVEEIAVRIRFRLACADDKGRDGLRRKLCGKAGVIDACNGAGAEILSRGGVPCIDLGDLFAAGEREALRDSARTLVDRDNCNAAVLVLVCGAEDIAGRLLGGLKAVCTRTHPLGILCHCRAALGDSAVIPQEAVLAANVPPDICAHVADDHCIVDVLSCLERLRPDISGVRIGVRDIDLCHPDLLAAAFQLREVHLAALRAVEVCTEQIAVRKCRRIGEDLFVIGLAVIAGAVLEALRRHQLGIGAFLDGLAVIRDEVRRAVRRPVCPFRRPVRLVLHGDGIQVDALPLAVLDEAVEVLCVLGLGTVVQHIQAGGVALAARAAHTCRRVPRRCKNGRAERLCALRGRDRVAPCVLVIADEDTQDGEAELVFTVSECRLHLLGSHVALGAVLRIDGLPFRMVHAAEAADVLMCCARVDDAVSAEDSERGIRPDGQTGEQHDAAQRCRSSLLELLLHIIIPLFSMAAVLF